MEDRFRRLPRPTCARQRDTAPFDGDAEYRRLVDGRSRYDGAAAFLTARGLHFPPGEPHDASGCGTVWAVAAHKERAFVDLLRTDALVVGVDRTPLRRTTGLLREQGAHLVVPDLNNAGPERVG